MRHRKTVNKLNRTAEHRKALLANLAASLFDKKRIKTTHAKAKATQQFVERLITIAKKDTLHARRIILSRIRQKSVVQTLFNDVVPTYKERNGGYTRVLRLGNREGDGAELSLLELVGFEEAMKKRAKEKKEKEAKKAAKESQKGKEIPEPQIQEAEVIEEETEKQEEKKPAKSKAAKRKSKKVEPETEVKQDATLEEKPQESEEGKA